MADTAQNPLTIDIFSDVVCPWCFIGKRRLERALAMVPEVPTAVQYRAYFLNEWVPAEGMARDDYLTHKFGSVDRYKANIPRMQAAGAEEGIPFAFERIARQPNTRDCQRLIRWASEIGRGPEMKERLMALYFIEGADLTDGDVLLDAAAACGLDRAETAARLASDEAVEDVNGEAEWAKRAGIDGVPCFIFGGVLAVSGAQAPEHIAGAIRQAAAEVRARGAA